MCYLDSKCQNGSCRILTGCGWPSRWSIWHRTRDGLSWEGKYGGREWIFAHWVEYDDRGSSQDIISLTSSIQRNTGSSD